MTYQPTLFDYVVSVVERLPAQTRAMLAAGPDGPGLGLMRLSSLITADLELAGEAAAAMALKHGAAIFDAVEGAPPTAFARLGSMDARVRRPAQEQIASSIAQFLKARLEAQKLEKKAA
jgi:hypothetical protein